MTTIQSTLRIRFTGIRCREFEARQHCVSLTLPPVLHGASDTALTQYVLFALTGGKMYSAINDMCIDEEAVELEIIPAEKQ